MGCSNMQHEIQVSSSAEEKGAMDIFKQSYPFLPLTSDLYIP